MWLLLSEKMILTRTRTLLASVLFLKETENTERRKLLLSKIAQFRLFDDDFMSKVFEDDIEATEFLLKIIL